MDSADLRNQIEADWTWRSSELRFLKNNLGNITHTGDRDRYRRSMVVMLYAHFEGFCKAALTVYVDAINNERLVVKEANPLLAAAALTPVFKELANPQRKNPFFKRALPDDTKLHVLSRRAAFVDATKDIERHVVYIDAEATVDTESNIKPLVLMKLFYIFGLDHNLAKAWSNDIDSLIGRRNAIAHGHERNGVDAKEYSILESAVEHLVRNLTVALFDAARESAFRRPL